MNILFTPENVCPGTKRLRFIFGNDIMHIHTTTKRERREMERESEMEERPRCRERIVLKDNFAVGF